MDIYMVMDLEVTGQIMYCLKLETPGTRVGPTSPLARHGPRIMEEEATLDMASVMEKETLDTVIIMEE